MRGCLRGGDWDRILQFQCRLFHLFFLYIFHDTCEDPAPGGNIIILGDSLPSNYGCLSVH
jgi:hypothetical protein